MKPGISYLICTMPRSGSHLLSEALQLTGIAGRPDEYFYCDEDGRFQNESGPATEIHGKKTVEEFYQLAMTLATTPNGVLGVVLMGSYFADIIKNFQALLPYQGWPPGELLAHLFHQPKYIWLTRHNKLLQAISMLKATQTGIWSAPKGVKVAASKQPLFDYESVKNFVHYFEEADQQWEAYFQANNIAPFKIVYEEFVENDEQTILDLLMYLGIEPPENLQFANRLWQKQADSISEEWATTYLRIKNHPSEKLALFAYKTRCIIGKLTVRKWLRQGFAPPS
jgi:LPS sulfotransferase NodH